MKNLSKILLAQAAAVGLSAPALAQEAMTIDQRVNATFATVTGPFVNFIFAPFPGTAFPWIVLWLVVAATRSHATAPPPPGPRRCGRRAARKWCKSAGSRRRR